MWSSRPNVTVKNLLEALESIERFDVIEDCHAQLVADCEVAINWKQEDLELVRTRGLLTAQVNNSFISRVFPQVHGNIRNYTFPFLILVCDKWPFSNCHNKFTLSRGFQR